MLTPVPTGLIVTAGQTLNDVVGLPEGWGWDDPAASVGTTAGIISSSAHYNLIKDGSTISTPSSVVLNVAVSLPELSMAGWEYGRSENSPVYRVSGSAVTSGVTCQYRAAGGTWEGSLPLSGAGKVKAGSYEVEASYGSVPTMTAGFTVTRKPVTLSAGSLRAVISRGGGVTFLGSPGISGVVSSDDVYVVSPDTSGAAYNKNTKTVTGVALGGVDAGNYTTDGTITNVSYTEADSGRPAASGGTSSGSGGGTGGGSADSSESGDSDYDDTKYKITVADAANGTVESSHKTSTAGTLITLTVRPDRGCALSGITVTTQNGKMVKLNGSANRYTFFMPTEDVTVTPVFQASGGSGDGGHNCPSLAFSDLDISQWYHEAVDFVLLRHYLSGYGNGLFGPGDNLTRAMAIQIIYNIAGNPEVTGSMHFTDVPEDEWYTSAVNWASGNGYVEGFGGGAFRPNESVTREQFITILWRYAGKVEPKGEDLPFGDAGEVQDYAPEAVLWAVEKGLINGYGDSLNSIRPYSSITRAEVSQILMKYWGNN